MQRCAWYEPRNPNAKAHGPWALRMLLNSTGADAARKLGVSEETIDGMLDRMATRRNSGRAHDYLCRLSDSRHAHKTRLLPSRVNLQIRYNDHRHGGLLFKFVVARATAIICSPSLRAMSRPRRAESSIAPKRTQFPCLGRRHADVKDVQRSSPLSPVKPSCAVAIDTPAAESSLLR